MITSDFLPYPNTLVCTKVLNVNERALKQKMFDAFITQRKVLANFPTEVEKLRQAPKYDYSKPPHRRPYAR